MPWDDLQIEILEDFARLQEVYYCDRHTLAVHEIAESRREAVRRYRESLSPEERRKQNRERWERRKAAPGFQERERERVLAWKRKRGMRERLSDLRIGNTIKFTIVAQKPHVDGIDPNLPPEIYEVDFYLTTGVYEDGRLGEVFLKIGKHGGEQAVYDAWATAVSVALQYGASIDLFRKWVGISFEPSGATSNQEFPRCTSVLDLCARYILARYGKPETEAQP